jgi:hypothetical protein
MSTHCNVMIISLGSSTPAYRDGTVWEEDLAAGTQRLLAKDWNGFLKPGAPGLVFQEAPVNRG